MSPRNKDPKKEGGKPESVEQAQEKSKGRYVRDSLIPMSLGDPTRFGGYPRRSRIISADEQTDKSKTDEGEKGTTKQGLNQLTDSVERTVSAEELAERREPESEASEKPCEGYFPTINPLLSYPTELERKYWEELAPAMAEYLCTPTKTVSAEELDPEWLKEAAVGIIRDHLFYARRLRAIKDEVRKQFSHCFVDGFKQDLKTREEVVLEAVKALPNKGTDGQLVLLEKLAEVAHSFSLKDAIESKRRQWAREPYVMHSAAANHEETLMNRDKAEGKDQVCPGFGFFTRPPPVSGERKVFGNPDLQGLDTTAAIAACGSKDKTAQTESPFKFEKLPYHDELGDVYPGTGRAVAGIFADYCGRVALRIRTTDKETDVAGLVELLETNDSIELVPLKPIKGRPPDIHEMQEEDIGYPRVCVVLRKTEHGNYYEVSAQEVPKERMEEAMALVDKVGRRLFEEKEIPHYPDSSALALARSFSKA